MGINFSLAQAFTPAVRGGRLFSFPKSPFRGERGQTTLPLKGLLGKEKDWW